MGMRLNVLLFFPAYCHPLCTDWCDYISPRTHQELTKTLLGVPCHMTVCLSCLLIGVPQKVLRKELLGIQSAVKPTIPKPAKLTRLSLLLDDAI